MEKSNLSNANKAIIDAHEKGYRVDKEGNVTSHTGKPISTTITPIKPYKRFGASIQGKVINILVHKFQAYQKYGMEAFDPNYVVRHFNGDSLNNTWDNIVLGDRSQNVQDIPKEQRHELAKQRTRRKLSDEELYEILKDRKSGMGYTELHRKYGLSKATLSWIFNKAIYARGISV